MPTKKTVAVTGTKVRAGKTAETTRGRQSSVKARSVKKSRASTKGQASGKKQPEAVQVPVATDTHRGKKAPSNENITTSAPRGLIQQPETLAQKRMAGRSAAARQMVDTKGLKVRAEGVKQAPHTRAVNNRGQ